MIGAIQSFLAAALATEPPSVESLAHALDQLALAYADTPERDFCDDDHAHPDSDYEGTCRRVAERFPDFGHYSVFDPTDPLTPLVAGAIDGIADIVNDLSEVLWRHEALGADDAIWHFRFGYGNPLGLAPARTQIVPSHQTILRPSDGSQPRRMTALGDGVDAPRRPHCARVEVSNFHSREASMGDVSTIGLDIAKNSFQAHGADALGGVVFRKKLVRGRVLAFFATQPPSVVAIEACGGAHHWGRELARLGHTVRLIPPAYVKPFVKRQKHDAADAEAICEAAQRPSMRFTPVKDEEQQASAVVFRARDLLVRQRTQTINALRGHLTEYGWVIAKGVPHVARLIERIEDPDTALPPSARSVLRVLVATLRGLEEQIGVLDAEIVRRSKVDPLARRLMTIPGVGPVIATAIVALAPAPQTFRAGRHFAAWIGLTPRQKSTGGKQRLGAISRMGERDPATAADHRGRSFRGQAGAPALEAPAGSWLAQMSGAQAQNAGSSSPWPTRPPASSGR